MMLVAGSGLAYEGTKRLAMPAARVVKTDSITRPVSILVDWRDLVRRLEGLAKPSLEGPPPQLGGGR